MLGVVIAVAAAGLALPAAAAAAPTLPAPPLGLLGLDVADLVESVMRGLVDLAVPDFASAWAATFVTWLVALPNVADWSHFAHLNRFRRELTAVGFGLLGVSFTAAVLQLCFGGGGAFRGADALKRAAIAAGVLAFYPVLLRHVITGVNLLTATAIKHDAVVDGLDTALGTALTLGAVTGGLSLGLAVAAAMASLYFIAALLVMKIGLTAALAVLMLSGSVVWGLYPLMPWLGRAWLSGLAAATAVPLAWALIFSAAALLSADALLWSTPGGTGQATPEWLDDIIKPFSAAACFWLAYKAPAFLLSALRVIGISPAAFISGPGGGGSMRGGPTGRTDRALRTAAHTNRDRFRALTSRGREPLARTAATAESAVRRVGARATVATGRRAAPLAAAIAANPKRARIASATIGGARAATRAATAVAVAPKRANDWWRRLPTEHAAAQRRQAPGGIHVHGDSRPEGRRATTAPRTQHGSPPASSAGRSVRRRAGARKPRPAEYAPGSSPGARGASEGAATSRRRRPPVDRSAPSRPARAASAPRAGTRKPAPPSTPAPSARPARSAPVSGSSAPLRSAASRPSAPGSPSSRPSSADASPTTSRPTTPPPVRRP